MDVQSSYTTTCFEQQQQRTNFCVALTKILFSSWEEKYSIDVGENSSQLLFGRRWMATEKSSSKKFSLKCRKIILLDVVDIKTSLFVLFFYICSFLVIERSFKAFFRSIFNRIRFWHWTCCQKKLLI